MDSATPPTEGKERSSKLNGTHFFLSCLSKPQSLSFPIHGFLPANYNGLKSNWQLREEDGFFSSIITILARSTPMLGAFHAIKKMKSLLKKNPLDYCCLFFLPQSHFLALPDKIRTSIRLFKGKNRRVPECRPTPEQPC